MIPANRLAPAGENAALARVRTIVEALDATSVERIGLSAIPEPSPDTHARLMARLEQEADHAGRRELLDDVRDQVRVTLVNRFSPLSARTGIGFPNPVNASVRASDEARVMLAVLDAVAVAVMEDRLDPQMAARLSEPGRQLLGLPPLGEADDEPLELSAVEPSAQDWADAARGSTRIGAAASPATSRVVIATVLACTLGPAALFAGVASGSTLVGIAAALAVVALCWLLATYRR